MSKYISPYLEAVTRDVFDYLVTNYGKEEIAEILADDDKHERLQDELWVADCVTGNGSGSYTFDREQAKKYVLNDIDTVREALRDFCVEADTIAEKFLSEDWEYFDVTARCYCLYEAIEAALKDVKDDLTEAG